MEDRTRWDERYSAGDWVDTREPAAIVRDAEPWLEAGGVALDAACGTGRNTVYLAQRGYRVIAVDLSVEGLNRLAGRARGAKLAIYPVLTDLEAFPLVHDETFDLIVNTHFLLRGLFPVYRRTLRPGGLLIFETYNVDELEVLGGDISREYVLERGELQRELRGFEMLLYEEGVFQREEGERGLARLIARKPGRTPRR